MTDDELDAYDDAPFSWAGLALAVLALLFFVGVTWVATP